eukprot:Anaeramoba_ignava/a90938_65.p2 GENE.a90938_65~~a90938_65.p2  ORF type:complete len:142 (-),score=10.00 a90938_65:959-1384(-)
MKMKKKLLKEKTIQKVMRSNKSKNTKLEIVFRKALFKKGIRGYRIHWKNIPGTPDIAFVGKKIAIFINGCFWHRCPYCNPKTPKSNIEFWETKFNKNIERDKKNIDELLNMNWRVIVFWECQIYSEIDKCIEKVKKELECS